MKDFLPSLKAVLAFAVVALVGFCMLQRAELQAVREENKALAQKAAEVEDLQAELQLLNRAHVAANDRIFDSE